MNTATPLLMVVLTDEQLEDLAGRVVVGLKELRSDRDEWLDLASAARHLQLHEDTVRKRAKAGSIPHQQRGPGCRIYFRRSQLDAWREADGAGPNISIEPGGSL